MENLDFTAIKHLFKDDRSWLDIGDIKEIDIENPEQTVKESYAKGEDIFRRSNNYFKKPIISFSKRLTKDQINHRR